MAKTYQKKSPADYKKEIDGYIESATLKIDSYINNEKDIHELLDFMGQFHTYSFRNQMLIHDQFDGAFAVGSFKAFSDAGFKINKGEKAIKILVPTPYNVYEGLDGKQKSYYETTAEEKKLIKQNKLPTKKQMAYKLGNVFDISQTNATHKDLPKIFPNRQYDFSFEGNENKMIQVLKDISAKNGVPVKEEMTQTVAKGAFRTTITGEKDIVLNSRLQPSNKIATLIHEMAHSKLHHSKDGLSSAEREFQAELVSNVVSKHFGLDTDEKSISYIATWTKNGKELSDKRLLIKEVHETAVSFIQSIHESYDKLEVEPQAEIMKEKQATNNFSVTKEMIQDAKNVSILEVANFHGHQVTQHSKKEFRLADNMSVAIFTDTNSFSDFAQNSEIKGGDSISFVQQVLGVTDFKEAVQLLNNPSFERVTIETAKKEAFSYDPTKESPTFNRARNYLVNERGINPRLIDKLHDSGYIREDKRGNVLLCWYDQGKMVGCTEQGTVKMENYERGYWKGIQKNSPAASHGFNVKFGEPEHLKFFEAGIDALSYATLNPGELKNTWLISMEGLNEPKMLDYVKRSFEQTGSVPKSISLGVDNDSAGLDFFKGLSQIKKELITNEIPKKPVGMENLEKWDWNNQLLFFQEETSKLGASQQQASGLEV